MSVAEAGRLLRVGDATIRRLIRTAVLRPVDPGDAPRLRRQEVEDLARLLLAIGPGGALARAAEGEAFRDELIEETNVALAQRLLRGLPGHDPRGGAP